MSDGGGGDQVVGYRYYMGMHLAICHGPVDAVMELRAGERVAWSGNVTANSSVNVTAPDLFGGDDREGGLVGVMDVMLGGSAQERNAYLIAKLGESIPAFRGVLSLVWRGASLGAGFESSGSSFSDRILALFAGGGGQISANNPYIKPWAIKVKRVTKGWNTGVWYSAKAAIGTGMNPAHIIYQCLTDNVWGMGYPTSQIDSASFTAAADTLHAEGFGLSMLWNQPESIENFIKDVLNHIGGVLHELRDTGAFSLRLIRDDYVVGNLDLFDESNIISLEDYQRAGFGETTNQITVNYTDPDTFKTATVMVQDMANITAQGGVVAAVRNYPGITSYDIASRVATRDLIAASTPLSSIKIKVNRDAWNKLPGDVIRVTWPKLGLVDVPYRVIEINDGTLTDGLIHISAAEDVFGLPDSGYTTQEPAGWQDPSNPPAAAQYRNIYEAPYLDLYKALSAADLALLDPLSGYLCSGIVRPTSDSINYKLYTRIGAAAFVDRGTGQFCPSATLSVGVGRENTSTLYLQGLSMISAGLVGKYAFLGNEAVLITAVDVVNQTATVERGVLDTTPQVHAIGARLWCVDGYQMAALSEYALGEVVDARVLPSTGQGRLDLDSAPTDQLTMAQRHYRPYPPGKFTINGQSYPTSITGSLISLAWVGRNRLQQTADIIKQSDNGITPEAGTTYNVRIYDDLGGLMHSANTAASTYDYTATSTVALLHFEGADASSTFTDEVGNIWTRSGSAQIDTAQYYFGAASGLFDGSGDYLTTPHSSVFDGQGDFTVELFVRPASITKGLSFLKKGTSYGNGWHFAATYNATGPTLIPYFTMYQGGDSSGTVDVIATSTLQAGVWAHVAVTKQDDTLRIFVNGVLEGTTVLTKALATNTASLYIGRDTGTTARDFNGHMDEVRISTACRYTATFTPPAAPFVVNDGSLPPGLIVEVESLRDGVVSWQPQRREFALA